MNLRSCLAVLFACFQVAAAPATRPATQPATEPISSIRYVGGDISMTPELERLGAVYYSACGDREDVIDILRGDDWNLFRVRVFVDPSKDFDATWGATQSLDDARAICKRVTKLGGKVFLCIHYSNTWDDPQHQTKPKAWAALPFDELEARVHDYTGQVLAALKSDGVVPEIVQVGNEVTIGMLWPDGQVEGSPQPSPPAQWAKLARLLNAGVRAVREASPPERPIRVALHLHGGGKIDLQKEFFDHIPPVDFDMVGLSFYPAFDESLDVLRGQIGALRARTGKEVFVAETSYPHKPLPGGPAGLAGFKWPLTPAGQAQFAIDLRHAVEASGGVGIVWWYPEAVPLNGHNIYRDGAEGVFDDAGKRLDTVDRLAGIE